MMKTKTVVVIATGGTIAGVRDNERVRHTIQGSWQSFLIIWVPVRMWPVVLTGAMRPAADVSPDDPRNLKQAVCVAASREAAGRNVMVFCPHTY